MTYHLEDKLKYNIQIDEIREPFENKEKYMR